MPIPTGNNELYFATGIDNTGLMRGQQQAIGIIRGMTSQISKADVFAGLAIAATVAFGKVSSEMKRFSEEFEHSMKEVQTISQAVQQDFEGYSKAIIDLTTQVPQSAKELSEAYYQIVSAGYDGAAGLSLLETSAKGAVGGVTDVKTAADGLTTVMNAWGYEASQASKVSDIFFNTVKLGKTTFGELASNIAQVAPLAAAYGVSFEQIASATATLTKQGTTTSMAMTQLRQALIAVNEELGQGWSKTMTLQEAFQEIADRAQDSGRDIKEFTGRVEGAMAIMSTTGEQARGAAKDLDSYTSAVGAANAAFGIMIEDSINQSALLKNNLQAALKPLGDFFAGKGTDFAKKMNEAFESGQVEKFGKFVATTTTALVAYKLTANGAALTTSLFTKATAASTAAMRGLNLAFKSNPFGLIAVGITAAVTAFQAFKKVSDDAASVSGKLSDEIYKDVYSLNNLFSSLKDAKKGTEEWNRIRETVNSRYGDYLDNLLTEKSTLEDIEIAQKKVTAAMVAQAGVKIYKSELEDQMAEYQKKFKKTMGDFTEVFSEYKGADLLPEFISAITDGIDLAIKEGGGKIERGMLEYSGIATEIYNKYIDDISRQTGYIKWDPKKFTKGFLDLAEFQAKESDFTAYLQGMIESFQTMISEGLNTEGGGGGGGGGGSGGFKLLETDALNDQIKAAERAFAELDKLRAAGLEKETGDLYKQYTKYGETFDKWLLAMRSKYANFATQLNAINLELADFIINKLGVFEENIDTSGIDAGFQRVGAALIKQINDKVKANLDIEITVPPGEVKSAVEKFSFLGQLFTPEQIKELEKEVNDFAYLLNGLSGVVSRVDEEMGESIRMMGQMVSAVGNFVEFAATKDIGALVDGIINMGHAIVGYLEQVTGEADKAADQAEMLERQAYGIAIAVGSINDALEEQYDLLNKLNGADWITGAKQTIQQINEAIGALESQMNRMTIKIDLPDNDNVITLKTDGWGAEDFRMALEDYGDVISADSRAEVQDFLDQIEQLKRDAEDLQIEIQLETVGFSFDSLVDDVMAMFEQMEDGAIDFGATFEEVMLNAVKNSFQNMIVEKVMKEFYDSLYEALDSPVGRNDRRNSIGNISPGEFTELEELWTGLSERLSGQYESIVEFMEQMGIDMSGVESSEDPNSLSGSIRRNLTEETGSVLAGRMNTIMLDTRLIATAASQMADSLQQIEANTSHNHNLVQIRADIQEIRNQLSA